MHIRIEYSGVWYLVILMVLTAEVKWDRFIFLILVVNKNKSVPFYYSRIRHCQGEIPGQAIGGMNHGY